MGDEDLTWLFDAVLGFLKSPGWALPVMSFIDDNCIVFDSGVCHAQQRVTASCPPLTAPTRKCERGRAPVATRSV